MMAAALAFVGEHVQVGLAPSYTLNQSSFVETHTYQSYSGGVTVNYVYGGGERWRGYAGGYASTTGVVHGPSTQALGAQVGALYFFGPALAARAELRYRAPTSGPFAGQGSEVLLVTLDPYVFGRASAARPGWAAFGAADVSAFVAYTAAAHVREISASATLAPYLTRWAQVGVDGQAVQGFEYGAYQARLVRGYGRLYLPLTARTQPFAEGFAEASTYDVRFAGLTGYGGTVGVRRYLNARVALDVGVRRRLSPALALDDTPLLYRDPGRTGLVAGLATRVGRTR